MSLSVMMITGGSRGIGEAVVRGAAGRYDIAVAHTGSVDVGELSATVTAAGARFLSTVLDVADETQVVDWFRQVDRDLGSVEFLVNNAGVGGTYGGIESVTAPILDRLWAVNLTGPFICAREAVAHMRTDRGGSGGVIVNVSSRAAVTGSAGEWIHYAASKGAIDTMTVGLAREVAAVGVRVAAVRPGLVDSDFHRHAPAGRLERLESSVPAGRAGTVDEIAAAVLWLCSPEASFTHGALLDVGGGR